jgi:hypothetical protein
MITITTIGFGDIVPKTAGGRVFVVFYASGGIVLFGKSSDSISSQRVIGCTKKHRTKRYN